MRSPEASKVVGIVDNVFGPTCRSVGLLVGRVHLTGTSGTLVVGTHGYPCLSKKKISKQMS
jgi:hypothetical protein